MKYIRIHIYLLFLIIFSTVFFACQSEEGAIGSKTNESAEETSSSRIFNLMASANIQRVPEVVKAPDFELPSANGEKIKLSQYRGKVVFLSFWTTW